MTGPQSTGLRRQKTAIGAFVFTVLLAGCLTTTVDVTVDEDGMIERMEVDVDMHRLAYGYLSDAAEQQGYESLEEFLRSEFSDQAWESIEYTEQETEDGIVATIVGEGGDPDEIPTIDVTVDDGEVTFVNHDGFGGEGFEEEIDDQVAPNSDDEIEFLTREPFPEEDELIEHYVFVDSEYIVHLPGEVLEANGDVLADGTSVQWSLDDHEDISTFQATSAIDASESIPAGGILLTVAGMIVLGLGLLAWRARR